MTAAAPAWAGVGFVSEDGTTLFWDADDDPEVNDGGVVYGSGPAGFPTDSSNQYQIGEFSAPTEAGNGCEAVFFADMQYITCGDGDLITTIDVSLGLGDDRLGTMPGSDDVTGLPNPFLNFGSPPRDPPVPPLALTQIDLGEGNDIGQGSSVTDVITLGPGSDGFRGGSGDDIYLEGGLPGSFDPGDPGAPTSGADSMDAPDANEERDEFDWVSYAGRTNPVFVTTRSTSPISGEAGEGDQTNVENAVGGSAADTLTGDPDAANRLVGLGGDDLIDVRHGGPTDLAQCDDGGLWTDDPDGTADTVIADTDAEANADCERVDVPGTPNTGITAGPGEGTTIAGDRTRFGFAATERGSTFECSIEPSTAADDFSACTSPFTTPRLGGGDYTFKVRATDPVAGDDGGPDTDRSPAARDFSVLAIAGATPLSCPRFNSAGVRCFRLPDGRLLVIGTDGANRLVGTDGSDLMLCRGGNDRAYGLGGGDLIGCGAGTDIVVAGLGNDLVAAGTGNDGVSGQGGNDRLYLQDGSDLAYGGSGNDRMYGQDGSDRMLGNAGDDRMSGGEANERMSGGDGNDAMGGGPGNDLMLGSIGSDLIFGSAGNDRLAGGSDIDRISCGRGLDLFQRSPVDVYGWTCTRPLI